MDCSSSFWWLGLETSKRLIRLYGSDRVLFGTDYPFWPLRNEVERLFALGLEPEEYENICWRNASKLYGLRLDGTEENHG